MASQIPIPVAMFSYPVYSVGISPSLIGIQTIVARTTMNNNCCAEFTDWMHRKWTFSKYLSIKRSPKDRAVSLKRKHWRIQNNWNNGNHRSLTKMMKEWFRIGILLFLKLSPVGILLKVRAPWAKSRGSTIVSCPKCIPEIRTDHFRISFQSYKKISSQQYNWWMTKHNAPRPVASQPCHRIWF